MGRKVNQTELAEIVGVSDVTLWQWQKEGMPIAVRNLRGLSNQYDTGEVIQWIADRATKKASGGESQEQRLKRVQADKIEMELGQMKRELLPASEVAPRWASIVLAARKKLISLPGQLAELLEMAEGPAAKRDLLTQELDKVLAELTDTDECERILEDYLARMLDRMASQPDDGAGDGDAQALGTAAAADGGGVGGVPPLSVGEEFGHAGAVPAGGGTVYP